MKIVVNSLYHSRLMKLQKLIDEFKSFLIVQKQRSNHTVSNYLTDIKQFITIVQLDCFDQINDPIIERYLTRLNQLQLSNQSIYRKLVSLDQFWKFLILKRMASNNPWEMIKRPKLKPKLPVFVEEKTVLELLDNYPLKTAEDQRNKAILELLFASGIRVSELTLLTLDFINLNQNECRVLGKGDKYRIALFGDRAKHAIHHYIDQVRPLWDRGHASHLFLSKQGKPLTTRTVQRVLKQANQYHSSSIEITPHLCRHTCASLLIINGAGIRDVQEFLGHSSITTTERYTHIPTASLKKRFLDAMH